MIMRFLILASLTGCAGHIRIPFPEPIVVDGRSMSNLALRLTPGEQREIELRGSCLSSGQNEATNWKKALERAGFVAETGNYVIDTPDGGLFGVRFRADDTFGDVAVSENRDTTCFTALHFRLQRSRLGKKLERWRSQFGLSVAIDSMTKLGSGGTPYFNPSPDFPPYP